MAEDLKSQYDDPIAHFKEVVAKMNEEEKANNLPIEEKIAEEENIEETFKVTKSELNDRPVYVSTKEHIEAHFLFFK